MHSWLFIRKCTISLTTEQETLPLAHTLEGPVLTFLCPCACTPREESMRPRTYIHSKAACYPPAPCSWYPWLCILCHNVPESVPRALQASSDLSSQSWATLTVYVSLDLRGGHGVAVCWECGRSLPVQAGMSTGMQEVPCRESEMGREAEWAGGWGLRAASPWAVTDSSELGGNWEF